MLNWSLGQCTLEKCPGFFLFSACTLLGTRQVWHTFRDLYLLRCSQSQLLYLFWFLKPICWIFLFIPKPTNSYSPEPNVLLFLNPFSKWPAASIGFRSFMIKHISHKSYFNSVEYCFHMLCILQKFNITIYLKVFKNLH